MCISGAGGSGTPNQMIICVLLVLSVQIGLLTNMGDLTISGFGECQSSELFSGNIFIVDSPLDNNGTGIAPNMST